MSESFDVVKPGEDPLVNRLSLKIPRTINGSSHYFSLGDLYFPRLNDVILGIVQAKRADGYTIAISETLCGFLPYYNFPQGIKQHFPLYQIDDVVLCGIAVCNPYEQIELSCIVQFEQKSWETNETYLGLVSGGYLQHLGVAECRLLCRSNHLIPFLIGKHIPCEIIFGDNGFIYARAETLYLSYTVAKAMRELLRMDSLSEMKAYCKNLTKSVIAEDD